MTRAAGFTLLELLLAVALTTTVMASAFAAADLFARADRIAIEGDERGVDVDRALRFLREDVQHAASLTVTSDQLTIEHTDGSCTAWLMLASSDELHRVTGASVVDVAKEIAPLRTAGPRKLERNGRGHLPDSTWSDTAVLQGDFALVPTAIASVYDGTTIGLAVRLTYGVGDERRQRTATMCSLGLAEAHAKPPQ